MKTLEVEIGENIRSDLHSDSAEKVYPDLPNMKDDWEKHKEYVKLRIKYLKDKDLEAYSTIKMTILILSHPTFKRKILQWEFYSHTE